MSDQPQALDSERAVIGILVCTPALADEIRAHVSPSEFFSTAHGAIYSAALAVLESGITLDSITVKNELARRGKLEAVGGPEAVSIACEWGGAPANAVHHASLVREASVRRRMIEFGRDLMQDAADIRRSPADLFIKTQEQFAGIEPSINGPTRGPLPLNGAAFQRTEFPEPVPLLGTSLWCAGELAILHAATGLGKTFLSEQIAHAIAQSATFMEFQTSQSPLPVLIYQGEVSPVRLQQRRHPAWPHGNPLVHTLTPSQIGRPLDILQAEDRLLLTRAIRDTSASVLILDPLRRIHSGPETNEGFVPLVVAFERIMLDTGCAILGVHHEPKTSTDQHPRSDIDAARGGTVLVDAAKMVMRMHRLPSKAIVLTWSKTSFGESPGEVYLRRDDHGYWLKDEPPVPVADRTTEAVEKALLGGPNTYQQLMDYCRTYPGAAHSKPSIRTALQNVAIIHRLSDRESMNTGSERRPIWVHPSQIIGTSENIGKLSDDF